jgi:hypothetical protein
MASVWFGSAPIDSTGSRSRFQRGASVIGRPYTRRYLGSGPIRGERSPAWTHDESEPKV